MKTERTLSVRNNQKNKQNSSCIHSDRKTITAKAMNGVKKYVIIIIMREHTHTRNTHEWNRNESKQRTKIQCAIEKCIFAWDWIQCLFHNKMTTERKHTNEISFVRTFERRHQQPTENCAQTKSDHPHRNRNMNEGKVIGRPLTPHNAIQLCCAVAHGR